MIPRCGISIRGLDYIQGSHTFQIGWIDSPHIGLFASNENRWQGGQEGDDIGMHGAAKDERQADGGRGAGWGREATLDDAYIRLKLIGIVPLADISYLLVVVAASDRRRLHLAPDERDNFRLDCVELG